MLTWLALLPLTHALFEIGLLPRELHGLVDGLVELIGELPLPLVHLCITRGGELLSGFVHGVGCPACLITGAALLTLLTLLALLSLLAGLLLALLALLTLLALLLLGHLLCALLRLIHRTLLGLLLRLLLRGLLHRLGRLIHHRLRFASLGRPFTRARLLQPLGQRFHFAFKLLGLFGKRSRILRALLLRSLLSALLLTALRLAILLPLTRLAFQLVGELLLRLGQVA
ncbi:MAG TPA: hypothetical protein VGE47_01510, partial [Burkholderiaceae bacterium]